MNAPIALCLVQCFESCFQFIQCLLTHYEFGFIFSLICYRRPQIYQMFQRALVRRHHHHPQLLQPFHHQCLRVDLSGICIIVGQLV